MKVADVEGTVNTKSAPCFYSLPDILYPILS